MKIEIIPVLGKKLLKEYLDFPHDLYHGDTMYVPEIFMSQKEMFDRKKILFLNMLRSPLIWH